MACYEVVKPAWGLVRANHAGFRNTHPQGCTQSLNDKALQNKKPLCRSGLKNIQIPIYGERNYSMVFEENPKMPTKIKLKICYGFFREWMNCKDYMDMDEPNTFRYHLASVRAYQIRLHLDRYFPKWMLEACAKMRSETYYRYKWQVQEGLEEYRQKKKRKKIGLENLEDIPF